jgi:hypothetical protein
MNDPKFQEASKLFAPPKPAPITTTIYELEQQAIRDNHQRLKQERLQREAASSS